ncbi:DNA repair protein RecN, partial [bacterium]|nr:DNA repair protein RecN [bacterium]
LSELDSLKRKYGDTLEGIFNYRESQLAELKSLENLETSYGELEKEIETLKQTVCKNAGEISKSRKKAVKEFEKLVLTGLHELGLERSKFKAEITSLPTDENSEQTYSAKGSDRVEFMIATNPGNPLKPLAKIASGGEISRIMLAIKTTLNEDISLNSMIFDEIDSGISGRVAETVGFKLVKLSLARQVICITHSPQIAAKALGHLRVEKKFKDNSSVTLVKQLDEDERVEEIARFLGGNEISEKTRSVARDMLTKKN